MWASRRPTSTSTLSPPGSWRRTSTGKLEVKRILIHTWEVQIEAPTSDGLLLTEGKQTLSLTKSFYPIPQLSTFALQPEPRVVQGPLHHVVPSAELLRALQPAGRVLRELPVRWCQQWYLWDQVDWPSVAVLKRIFVAVKQFCCWFCLLGTHNII